MSVWDYDIGTQGTGRLVHPALAAQSNNGYREDERRRRRVWDEYAAEKRDGLRHPQTAQGESTNTEIPGQNGPTSAALRALIPYELSLEVCLACEDPTPHASTLDAYQ